VRHRQTKGAATDMFDLPSPRHISTLRNLAHDKGRWVSSSDSAIATS
jgi:hypothetical protein